MKKIDKEFCLTDDSVNVYGYRLMTAGLQLKRFNPPIGFLMHDREKGVAVRWEDFRISEGALYAKPVVNEAKFPELVQQIEGGFYSAASVGHIVALKTTYDDAYKLEGQTGPTVLEWFPRECSIVDIPGNYHAIAQLYDESDNVLHDLSFNYINDMEQKQTIEVAALNLPNLAADATAEQVVTVIQDLVAKAARTDKAEKDLVDLKSKMVATEVQSLVDKGVAEKKLTQQMADKLKADYATNPDGLKDLIAAIPAQQTIASQLNTNVPEKFAGKTYHELYVSGELAEVKKNYPDLYEQLKQQN